MRELLIVTPAERMSSVQLTVLAVIVAGEVMTHGPVYAVSVVPGGTPVVSTPGQHPPNPSGPPGVCGVVREHPADGGVVVPGGGVVAGGVVVGAAVVVVGGLVVGVGGIRLSSTRWASVMQLLPHARSAEVRACARACWHHNSCARACATAGSSAAAAGDETKAAAETTIPTAAIADRAAICLALRTAFMPAPGATVSTRRACARR